MAFAHCTQCMTSGAIPTLSYSNITSGIGAVVAYVDIYVNMERGMRKFKIQYFCPDTNAHAQGCVYECRQRVSASVRVNALFWRFPGLC